MGGNVIAKMILGQDRGLGQDQGKSGLKAVTLGQEPREACDYSYLHYKDLQEKNELNYSFFKIQYFSFASFSH
jgi:hypothetical protein